jgi:RNA polymerase sigma-70 factor, ECF subfamily
MEPSDALEKVFREEYNRIKATLIHLFGSSDLAEESLQEAFASAVANWERSGVPDNPGAWLTKVAQRKCVDAIRRNKTKADKQSELEYEAERSRPFEQPELHEQVPEYPDDTLRLIFTCCHPSLTREAQVALSLRTLGGLTTTEIAKAFLVPEPTLAQRLVRAKSRIRAAGINYEIPSVDELEERMPAVREVLYLIFYEGYSAAVGQRLIRADLCCEAIRLARFLSSMSPIEAENIGLLALMLLQHSRRQARINRDGQLMTLDQQDRSLWDRVEIEEGLKLIEKALRLRQVGNYQLQAAIAATHAEAETAAVTDWPQIAALYKELLQINSSSVVALNYAVAVAMSEGYEKGLALMDEAGATRELDGYYLFHASRADLLRRLGRRTEAATAYDRAISLTTNLVERDFLKRRLLGMGES